MSFLSFLTEDFDGAIEVAFPMRSEVWETVLVDANERVVLEEEGCDKFVVRYLHITEFELAKTRFNGQVEYQVV